MKSQGVRAGSEGLRFTLSVDFNVNGKNTGKKKLTKDAQAPLKPAELSGMNHAALRCWFVCLSKKKKNCNIVLFLRNSILKMITNNT